ncbi:ribosome-assembly protein 3-domain-containing protein [Cercophora scortea]|uniref:Ribosome assembly protein 3 n=1 Tax=Cercophora scortea TaxID=314031 RepID=A0AAE0M673_9PEZI|nr:ribosome-assembly protein 3-domain-containing protein [Cercophora scortea]
MSSAQKSTKSTMTDQQVASEFTSYYLSRVTQEFAEDLDKVRAADDFKNDAIQLLVNALQQGTALFSPEEQRRIVAAEAAAEKPTST